MSDSLQAVVFDWAGTVVDYGSRAPARVFMEVFERSGVPITEAQAREPMGKAKRAHIAAVMAMADVSARWEQQHGAAPTEKDIDELYATFLPLQKEVLAEHCQLIPGVLETVEACRERGLKIGGTTGYTKELMEVVLPLAASQGYEPDVSLAADDVPSGRPAPWLLFEFAKRVDVYPLSTLVKVDDTPVGILAGRNAGAWTVGVTRSGNEMGRTEQEIEAMAEDERRRLLQRAEATFRDAGADYVVETIADLPPILDNIQRRLSGGDRP